MATTSRESTARMYSGEGGARPPLMQASACDQGPSPNALAAHTRKASGAPAASAPRSTVNSGVWPTYMSCHAGSEGEGGTAAVAGRGVGGAEGVRDCDAS